ncbi:MAG TPA: GNAT family N-acetyltransferase [Streptosporangiaceae bacterium]
MPAVTGDTAYGLGEQVTRRLAAIDPLLPAPAVPAGCGADLAVTGPDGSVAALGTCEHWAGEPGSLELTWGAARRFQLTPRMAGPDVPAALDGLLARWRDHLAAVPEAAEEDTAVVVTWPTRDIDGAQPLLQHGLAPRAVIAARGAGRRATTGPPVEPGVRIRQAGPADLDEVVRLGLETVRYDAHFGTVIERPETPAALRHEVANILAAPDPWVWLAERDGASFGLLYAERPEFAGWIAPMVRAAPVAYLELMDLLPGERGRGVAAALVRELHRAADASGVEVTLLHYEQVNPLSGPFWHQQGYRPLWTSWEARPASTLR